LARIWVGGRVAPYPYETTRRSMGERKKRASEKRKVTGASRPKKGLERGKGGRVVERRNKLGERRETNRGGKREIS